jgi:tetratricopeptide (TPR) repeat protein
MRSVVSLADAYRAAGDIKESRKLFKKALKLKGKDDSACSDYLTGECCYGLGKIKMAKKYLERAIQRASNHSGCPKRCCFEAEFTLGLIALDEGDKVTALDHYKKVLDTVRDRDYLEAASLFE